MLFDDFQAVTTVPFDDAAIKAGFSSCMTNIFAFFRVYSQHHNVLIAIQPDLDDAQSCARCFALAPKRTARPAPEPCQTGFQRFCERFFIHVCDHQHITGKVVADYGRQQAVGIESWLKFQAFFNLPCFTGGTKSCRHQASPSGGAIRVCVYRFSLCSGAAAS